MNYLYFFICYFLIGIFTAIFNLFNAISTNDPEKPETFFEICSFLVQITIFWPCNVVFNLINISKK